MKQIMKEYLHFFGLLALSVLVMTSLFILVLALLSGFLQQTKPKPSFSIEGGAIEFRATVEPREEEMPTVITE